MPAKSLTWGNIQVVLVHAMLTPLSGFEYLRLMRRSLTGLLIASMLSIPAPSRADLPTLGDQTAAVSTSDEYAAGRAYEKEFRAAVPTLLDPLIQDYVEHLIYRLAFATPLSDLHLSVLIIDSTEINAFAVPGGVVGVNAGIFLSAHNEAEMASVLAHELGHLRQRHYARMMMDSSHDMLWFLASVLAAVALSARGQGDAGAAAVDSAQAALAQHQLHYSRENEQEADRIGLQTLVTAGYDPEAMPRFFARLYKTISGSGDIPEYLQDHPLTPSRVADTAARAAQFHVHGIEDTLAFELMRARVKAHYAADPETSLNSLREIIAHGDHSDEAMLARFMACNLLLLLDRGEEGLAYAQDLLQQSPHRIAYVDIMADLLLHAGRHAQALALLQSESHISPTSLPLRLLLVRALSASGQGRQAESLAEELVSQRADDPNAWTAMIVASRAAADRLALYRARAELDDLYGHSKEALQQLRLGLQAAGSNYPEHARFESLIERVSHEQAGQ